MAQVSLKLAGHHLGENVTSLRDQLLEDERKARREATQAEAVVTKCRRARALRDLHQLN